MVEKDRSKSKYSEAGVDINRAVKALEGLKDKINATHRSSVLQGIGSFGALLHPGAERYRDPVLVMSIDGVGTKLKIAFLTGRHDTIGQDLVNHCVNDILVQGAKPLAFMDYFATGKLTPDVIEDVMSGLVTSCLENDCSLIGGETAEMPGFYANGEYDLAGCIIGIIEKENLIDGSDIVPGDVIVGLTSTGLHTNGYSLARKVIFETCGLDTAEKFPGTEYNVGELLLEVHRSYFKHIEGLIRAKVIKGMVHITGGGYYDNVPRVLPGGITAVIDTNRWTPPFVFDFLQEQGGIPSEEMYHVFNMGVGFLLVVSKKDADRVLEHMRTQGIDGILIGHIESGDTGVELILPRD